MPTKQYMITILAGWLMIFVLYIGYQEFHIYTGTKVRLQTRPVDPNDFFRGDYVVLGYDISDACNLPMIDTGQKDENGVAILEQQYHSDSHSDMTGREKATGGKIVYIPLIASGDVMVASGCLLEKPNSLSIKGLRQQYRSNVQYGIEKYFVQQGQGKPLENATGTMKVQVSVSREGQARIVGYKLD